MALLITLLGHPGATRNGAPVAGLRGVKGWALLAYLVRADRPVPRDQLARLLFPDATDPAATLRWNLSQLRRHLDVELSGDPVTLSLPRDTEIDLTILARGDSERAVTLPDVGDDLLAGVSIADSPAFDVWLEGERRHVRSMTASAFREAAVARLARGDAAEAVAHAERVVQLDPLDENAAIVLVRALREAGHLEQARSAADAAAQRLRDELGVEPSAALWSAVHATPGGTPRTGGRVAVEVQLDAGEAALAAGAIDAGIDALRGAVSGSRADGDPTLLARSLSALATALIHAVRGTDQDALPLLHEAIPLAEAAGLPSLAATAERELGYVDVLRGRYERAERWFDRARIHAQDDDEELAWIETFAGMARSDVGDVVAARRYLDDAVGHAQAAAATRAEAMARSMRGRLLLLAGDDDPAVMDLDAAVEMARWLSWRSFQPWPQTLRAEIALRHDELGDARDVLEAALATGRQIGDPCWEGMALRGLGIATAAEDHLADGAGLLEDAVRRCRRLPDTYLWVVAYSLDALADLGVRERLPQAADWVHRLEVVSTSNGMRPLAENAARYRDELGAAASTA